ncbi:hypothetical protein PVAP13_9NG075400 [Panicum virgatum]|uniref:ResB-like domain-containing protein n=1 Tax=Panicum virgatum TaxID=38727 RepID=A0A8T0MI76_PANVG|nr:hypothetical protein PVAP13_9NG075400 [Panicum virgatum]
MPSPASYLLLLNPAKSFSLRRLSHPQPSPRLQARRPHVSCDAQRGGGSRTGGGGRREAIPAGASKAKKQIVFFDAAPPVAQPQQGGSAVEKGEGEKATTKAGSGNAALALLRRATKKTLAVLSNLPLAISEMFAIAALMALGTVIDQGEAPSYYFEKFPEDNPVFGFITWRWILTPGFDHMFSSPVFLGLLALLALSLMACTYTTQLPMVKVARRWSFTQSGERIKKQEFADSLPRASIQDLGVILMGAGYEVFTKGPSLYAFKGLAGRYAPIGVHLAMLFIMAGATLSATGSFKGSVDVPQGLNFVIGDVMKPRGVLSVAPDVFNTEILIEDAIGSTGLDLKTDPGVPIVYAGFGALMLTTCISYLSHSQIWALQDGSTVVVGGKTNRAKLEFSEEMNQLLDKVPELIGANNENVVDSKSTAT